MTSIISLPMKRQTLEPGAFPDTGGLIHDLNEQNRSFKKFLPAGGTELERFGIDTTSGAVFSDRTYVNLFPCPWKDSSQKQISQRDLLFLVNAPGDKKRNYGGKYMTLSKLNNLMAELHRAAMKDWEDYEMKYGGNGDGAHPMEWVQHHSSSAWESREFRKSWKKQFNSKIKDFIKFEIPYYVRKFISFLGVVVTGTTSSFGTLIPYHSMGSTQMTSMVACCKGTIEVFNFWGPDVKQFHKLWIVFRRVIASGPIVAVPMASFDLPSIYQRGYYKKLNFGKPEEQPEFLEQGWCLRVGMAVGNFENIQSSNSIERMSGLTTDGKVVESVSATFSKAYLTAWITCNDKLTSFC